MAFDAWLEGRLKASPRRWLLDLRHLYNLMMVTPGAPLRTQVPPSPAQPTALPPYKQAVSDIYQAALEGFLASPARLRFPRVDTPKVSVLLVLFNRAELTLRCLRSLFEHTSIPLEVVIVDNNSSDQTTELLRRVDGARIFQFRENLGFLRACNTAADAARGEYLLFLNNDAELFPGSLECAVRTIERSPSIGAVGGRLILPNGRLQEAGSIIWRDGSCLGYGRDDSPWASEYAYARDVDYCSGALLLTPRTLFTGLGGFDEAFAPAYYEDSDWCVRIWKAGKRVVYHPSVAALHFEFASSASPAVATTMQLDRRALFVAKHRDWLERQHDPTPSSVLNARDRRQSGLRVLVVDDRVPHPSAGFGFPRALDFIRALVDLGHFVTLYPTAVFTEAWSRVYEHLPETVEVITGMGPRRLHEFFEARRGYYDRIVVSRPHNMQMLRAKLGPPESWSPPAAVIYDAEAIAALREIARRRLSGERVDQREVERLVHAEVALADGVSAVLAVSEQEKQWFAARVGANVHVVSLSIPAAARPPSFDEREGILFIGAFHELSPNADAVLWFAREVLPRVGALVGSSVPFTIIGQDPPQAVLQLQRPGVRVCPGVKDLIPFYDAARIFVAPTRFAAGIPFKVGHAAAHGVPIVATQLLAKQLEWRDGEELLVADDAARFAAACALAYTNRNTWQTLQRGALARVAEEYSPSRFRSAIAASLTSLQPALETERIPLTAAPAVQ